MKTLRTEYMVPLGWLVAVVGACGTAILSAFGIGIAVATLSSKVDAQGQDITKLQSGDLSERMVRVETLLSFAFPDEYKRALAEQRSHAPDRR